MNMKIPKISSFAFAYHPTYTWHLLGHLGWKINQGLVDLVQGPLRLVRLIVD